MSTRIRVVFAECGAVLLAILLPLISSAGDFYVDANNGNDLWDGSSATRGAGDVGPKKTLVAVMSLVTANEGEVVHAAPGFYTNGEAQVSSLPYRVVVPRRTTLVASGRADETFIVGASAPADAADYDGYGNGTGAMRCVYLNDNAVVQGFTITGGRTQTGGYGAGVGGSQTAWVVDCVVSNNVAGSRGGAIYFGPSSMRCYFAHNRAVEGIGDSVGGSTAYNCVCGPCYGYHFFQTTSYNCTFVGRSSRDGNTYNAIVLDSDGGRDKMYNCLYVKSLASETMADEACRMVSASQLVLDENYRPVCTNVAIDAGNMDYYTNNFSNILDQMPYDFAKGTRLVGTIDVGAGEFDWRDLPPESGIEFSITLDVGGTKLRVWRNFTSVRLAKGFRYGGTTVMFDTVEGGVWEATVEGSIIADSLVPIYNEGRDDWYVNPDPNKGDDAYPGYHPDCPKRTLMGAMALVKYGDVVHAAAGVYNEGQTTDNTSSRVSIPDGVGLVSDMGAENTVIEGYTPVYYDAGNEKKIGGVGAIRCVLMSGTAYVKGFTLRNGATCPALGNAYGDNGGGVSGGTAIDCIITNCYAVRGGGVAGANLIRCYVNDCSYVTGTNSLGQVGNNNGAGVYLGTAYDSCILSASLNISRIVNCSVISPWHNSAGSIAYNSYLSDASTFLAITNCVVEYVRDGVTLGEESYKGVINVDAATRRPVEGDLAIDAGNVAYYTYPAGFEHEMGKDFKGGQRVYNGRIDIGCGEYDWRGEFSAKIGEHCRATVAAASANVTTNTLDGIVLGGGDSVDVDYTIEDPSKKGKCSFQVVVSGEGAATVTFGDKILLPDGAGRYEFKNAAGANRITISFEGAGSAVVSGFSGPQVGLNIIVR